MLNFGPTFIWVAVNLLFLYFVLRWVLFKPVTLFMENRTNSIQKAIADADKQKETAEGLKQQYEHKLETAKSESDRIIKEARERAEREYNTTVDEAKAEASSIIEKARLQIERDRAEMMKEIRSEVVSLALSAASKVIQANMDSESNKEIVERFIDEEGVA